MSLVEARCALVIQPPSVYLIVCMLYIVLPDWATSRLAITIGLPLQSFVEFCSKKCQGARSVHSSEKMSRDYMKQ
jgi:hypothetical protein